MYMHIAELRSETPCSCRARVRLNLAAPCSTRRHARAPASLLRSHYPHERRTAVAGGAGSAVTEDSGWAGGSGGSAAERVAGRSGCERVAGSGEPAALETAALRAARQVSADRRHRTHLPAAAGQGARAGRRRARVLGFLFVVSARAAAGHSHREG